MFLTRLPVTRQSSFRKVNKQPLYNIGSIKVFEKQMSKKYAVIIADIKGSKKMAELERYEWQLFLKSAIVQVNENWREAIEAQFMITKGDEFQGVISSATHLFKFILNFEEMLRDEMKGNIDFRYGFGVGKITTQINKEAAIGMDGPAFYNARESLMSIKKENLKYGFKSNTNMDIVINTLLHWLDDKIKNWTAPKMRIINMYREEQTQKRILPHVGT